MLLHSITAAHSFRILYFGSKISSTNKPIHIYNSFKFIADIVFFIRNNFSIYSSNKKLFRNKNNFFATKKLFHLMQYFNCQSDLYLLHWSRTSVVYVRAVITSGWAYTHIRVCRGKSVSTKGSQVPISVKTPPPSRADSDSVLKYHHRCK